MVGTEVTAYVPITRGVLFFAGNVFLILLVDGDDAYALASGLRVGPLGFGGEVHVLGVADDGAVDSSPVAEGESHNLILYSLIRKTPEVIKAIGAPIWFVIVVVVCVLFGCDLSDQTYGYCVCDCRRGFLSATVRLNLGFLLSQVFGLTRAHVQVQSILS